MKDVPLEANLAEENSQIVEDKSKNRITTLKYIALTAFSLFIWILIELFVKYDLADIKKMTIESSRSIPCYTSDNKNYFNIFLTFSPISLYMHFFQIDLTLNQAYPATDAETYPVDLNTSFKCINELKTIKSKSKTHKNVQFVFPINSSRSNSINIFKSRLKNTTTLEMNVVISSGNIEAISSFDVSYKYWTPNACKFIKFMKIPVAYFGLLLLAMALIKRHNDYITIIIMGAAILVSTNPLSMLFAKFDEFKFYFVQFQFYLVVYRIIANYLFMKLVRMISHRYIAMTFIPSFIQILIIINLTNEKESFTYFSSRFLSKKNMIYLIICDITAFIPCYYTIYRQFTRKFADFQLMQVGFMCFIVFDILVGIYTKYFEFVNRWKFGLISQSMETISHTIAGFLISMLTYTYIPDYKFI